MVGTTATTAQIIAMAEDAEKRNRAANLDFLKKNIDPYGVHVVAFGPTPHRGGELRTLWYIKTAGQELPDTLWLDVDVEVYVENTTLHEG